jgi:hypothetical protein
MDWAKLPFERLFTFGAALVPGSALLLIVYLHNPQLLIVILRAPDLGYHTKMAIVILCAFAGGWTACSALRALVGALIEALLSVIALPQTETPVRRPQPWHNANWRKLLTSYLANAAPENVPPIYQDVHEAEMKAAEAYPDPLRGRLIYEAKQRKSAADSNDFQWSDWYRHLHRKTLTTVTALEEMSYALAFSFAATSVILLAAMPSTAPVRRWWVGAASAIWLLLILAHIASTLLNFRDPWSSFAKQIEFLQQRLEKGEHFTARA